MSEAVLIIFSWICFCLTMSENYIPWLCLSKMFLLPQFWWIQKCLKFKLIKLQANKILNKTCNAHSYIDMNSKISSIYSGTSKWLPCIFFFFCWVKKFHFHSICKLLPGFGAMKDFGIVNNFWYWDFYFRFQEPFILVLENSKNSRKMQNFPIFT